MQVNVTTPDEGSLVKGAELALAGVHAIEIDSPEMYETAATELAGIKGRIKKLTEQRVAITKPLDDAKKAVMDLFRRPLAILEQAEGELKGTMLRYQQAEEARRREAQRIADESARQQREAMEREAREKEEAARREAEAGNTEAAEQLQAEADVTRETAQVVTAPVVAAPAPKAAGTAVKETWKAEVTDAAALVKHIAQHPELLNLVTINQSALNQMAKALKANLNLPGVRAYPEQSLSSRAA